MNGKDCFLHTLDVAAVEAEGRFGLQGFESVRDFARVHEVRPVRQTDCRDRVAAGRVVCCWLEAERLEFGGHVGVFDPLCFVGNVLEVKGSASLDLSVRCFGGVRLEIRAEYFSMDSATSRHNGLCWGDRTISIRSTCLCVASVVKEIDDHSGGEMVRYKITLIIN